MNTMKPNSARSSQGFNGGSTSHQLGRSLRQHCEERLGAGAAPVNGTQLLAVLRDCHDPRSGDVIVYEWVMRQQPFLALAKPTSGTSQATRELSVLALIEDAATLFNRTSLQRIRDFLEGFIAAELPAIIPAPTATRDGEQTTGSTTGDQQAHWPVPSHSMLATAPQPAHQSSLKSTATLPKQSSSQLAPPSQATTSEPSLFQAAVACARQRRLIDDRAIPDPARSRKGRFFYVLCSANGKVLAQLNLQGDLHLSTASTSLPKPRTQTTTAAAQITPQAASPSSLNSVPAGLQQLPSSPQPSVRSAPEDEELFAAAMTAARSLHLIDDQATPDPAKSYRGLFFYVLRCADGKVLARLNLRSELNRPA